MTPKTYANFLEANMDSMQKGHDNDDKIRKFSNDKSPSELLD